MGTQQQAWLAAHGVQALRTFSFFWSYWTACALLVLAFASREERRKRWHSLLAFPPFSFFPQVVMQAAGQWHQRAPLWLRWERRRGVFWRATVDIGVFNHVGSYEREFSSAAAAWWWGWCEVTIHHPCRQVRFEEVLGGCRIVPGDPDA